MYSGILADVTEYYDRTAHFKSVNSTPAIDSPVDSDITTFNCGIGEHTAHYTTPHIGGHIIADITFENVRTRFDAFNPGAVSAARIADNIAIFDGRIGHIAFDTSASAAMITQYYTVDDLRRGRLIQVDTAAGIAARIVTQDTVFYDRISIIDVNCAPVLSISVGYGETDQLRCRSLLRLEIETVPGFFAVDDAGIGTVFRHHNDRSAEEIDVLVACPDVSAVGDHNRIAVCRSCYTLLNCSIISGNVDDRPKTD